MPFNPINLNKQHFLLNNYQVRKNRVGTRLPHLFPFICPLSPLEPHWNLIGISSEPHRDLIETTPKDHRTTTEG